MQTEQAAASFVRYLRLRSLSSRTVEFYQWGISHLMKHCLVLPTTPRELLPVVAHSGLNQESRHDLERALKRFLRWAAQEYDLPDPTIGMERTLRRKKLPRVLSPEEVSAVWEVCQTHRDRGMVGLVLDTGLRVGEIASLTKRNLNSFGSSGRGESWGETGADFTTDPRHACAPGG